MYILDECNGKISFIQFIGNVGILTRSAVTWYPDTNINRKTFSVHILGCAKNFVHWLLWERKNHQLQISYSIIGAFEGRNRQETASNEEEKSILSLRQGTVSKVDNNDSKTTWTALRITSAPTLFSRYSPGDYWLFADLKKCSRERDLAPMKKWYRKLRRFFLSQRQIVLQKSIEWLEKRWNLHFTLEGDYVKQ